MPDPYYTDELVTLYLGDCREITDWVACDVLVTDPPYGIRWKQGSPRGYGTRKHDGIQGDNNTAARDQALEMFGPRHAIVFGSPYGIRPPGTRHTMIWRKPLDTGFFGSIAGWRKDYEEIYLVGPWKGAPAARSSVLQSNTVSHTAYSKRDGHPHAKPIDVLERLIMTCPPGTVADPFAGSGSTLVAAVRQCRHAIGVEIEERYCEIAARRLAQGVLDSVAPGGVFGSELQEIPSDVLYEQVAFEGGAP